MVQNAGMLLKTRLCICIMAALINISYFYKNMCHKHGLISDTLTFLSLSLMSYFVLSMIMSGNFILFSTTPWCSAAFFTRLKWFFFSVSDRFAGKIWFQWQSVACWCWSPCNHGSSSPWRWAWGGFFQKYISWNDNT